jgi:poly(A) polymerase
VDSSVLETTRIDLSAARGPAWDAACAVVRRLRAAGHKALFAGGCVRDLLLGNVPQDFDVATDARPGEVAALFERTVGVGAAFGVTIVLTGDIQTEVATFRSDAGYADGRHPVAVAYTDARADVLRRDFTINARLLDPERAEVLDYVRGRADLAARIIRTVGDPAQRFAEDRLRLLRAVRFASRLDFKIDAATWDALASAAPAITQVSAERIRDELISIFTGPRPGVGLRLLYRSGLLAAVLPEVSAMAGVAQPEQFHPEGDVMEHTALVLDRVRDAGRPSPALAFAALLHDVGKPQTFQHLPGDRIRFPEHERVGASMADAICRRLKFSNDDRERVAALVSEHMRFKDAQAMRPATLRRFVGQPWFEDHLALHRADCAASHGSMDAYDFCLKASHEAPPLAKVARLLTGKDLMDMGLKPGPAFSEILTAAMDAQLAGEVASPDEARAWAKKTFPECFCEK